MENLATQPLASQDFSHHSNAVMPAIPSHMNGSGQGMNGSGHSQDYQVDPDVQIAVEALGTLAQGGRSSSLEWLK